MYGGDRLCIECGVEDLCELAKEWAGLAADNLMRFGECGIIPADDDEPPVAEDGIVVDCGVLRSPSDDVSEATRFLVPPLNIALTSSHAYTMSCGGPPKSFMCRRQELKLAASGCTYLSLGPIRCE